MQTTSRRLRHFPDDDDDDDDDDVIIRDLARVEEGLSRAFPG